MEKQEQKFIEIFNEVYAKSVHPLLIDVTVGEDVSI